MNRPEFEIQILRQHWIKDDGSDDKSDLCSHGEVFVRIGSEELSSKDAGSWSLSTAALFLMRSLERDCELQENSNFMVPCCGHTIYPIPDGDKLVVVTGCCAGVDWKVTHLGNSVELETENGTKAVLPFDQYREVVLTFVNEVEEFYGNPDYKTIPKDKSDADGFKDFWLEWQALKNKCA